MINMFELKRFCPASEELISVCNNSCSHEFGCWEVEHRLYENGVYTGRSHICSDHDCITELPFVTGLLAENKRMRDALETLARLGNGDKYGNSDGNIIAHKALEG
jgi:hypothetical protein